MTSKRDALRSEVAALVKNIADFEGGLVIDGWRELVSRGTEDWTIGSDSQSAGRFILFSDDATRDVEHMVLISQVAWKQELSDRYIEFLRQSIMALAATPEIGEPFETLPGWYWYCPSTFPYKKAGQLIVFQPIENGIAIAFLLNLRGPYIPEEPPGMTSISRRHIVGPAWAGCSPEGRRMQY